MTSSDDILKQRQEKLIGFFRRSPALWQFLLPIIIIAMGIYIRVQNLPLLKDTTTGKYVPLALDPLVFLRYSEFIAQHGILMTMDMMRNYPLGLDLRTMPTFLSFFIVYLHSAVSTIFPWATLQYVDVIYPVIAYVLFVIFFFLLVRRLFDWKVASLASLFITILPTFIYRSMAGFADHDILSLALWAAAFYAYVIGWQSKRILAAILFGAVSGVLIGYEGLTAGNVEFPLIIIGAYALTELLLNKFSRKDFYQYVAWFVVSFSILAFTTSRYGGVVGLLTSFTSGIALLTLVVGLLDLALFKLDLFRIRKKIYGNFPLGLVSFMITIVIGLISAFLAFGPGFFIDQFQQIYVALLYALGGSRWALTVAENHQPYFVDWLGQLTSWYVMLFLLGSIWLFYEMMKPMKSKIRWQATIVYTIFLGTLVLSRLQPSGTLSFLNGETLFSEIIYIGGLLLFIGYIIFGYLYAFFRDKELYSCIQQLESKYTFILIWFFLMIVAARTASRLLTEMSPITAIMAAIFIVQVTQYLLDQKSRAPFIAAVTLVALYPLLSPVPLKGLFILIAVVLGIGYFAVEKKASYAQKHIIVALMLVFVIAMTSLFAVSAYMQNKNTGPSYNQQWQKGMQWVRNNTPKNSVFIHWWDYGYWVQYGGDRPTVTDGGNNIVLWNYFIGRHLLTAHSQDEALELTKTYGADYMLIISDDIGKYTAYSSIGSDKSYDRYSWITTFVMDQSQTIERRNNTEYVFAGGYPLDHNFIYNGMIFPAEQAYVGAVIVPMTQSKVTFQNQTFTTQNFEEPTAIFLNNGQRTDIPLKCVYYEGKMYKWDGDGYDGCLRIMPRISQEGYNRMGAALFVSEEVHKGLMANLYLYNQVNEDWNSSQFTLVHSEQHPALVDLNNRYPEINIPDLALYGGTVIGPLNIWSIDAPEDIPTNPKYLMKTFEEAGLEEVTKVRGRDY